MRVVNLFRADSASNPALPAGLVLEIPDLFAIDGCSLCQDQVNRGHFVVPPQTITLKPDDRFQRLASGVPALVRLIDFPSDTHRAVKRKMQAPIAGRPLEASLTLLNRGAQ